MLKWRAIVALSLFWLLTQPLFAQIPGIGPLGSVQRAHTGFQFTEGPAADAQGNVYFSDVQGNRIHKLDTNGQLSTFLENTQGINGLMFDRRGRLLACQSGAGRIVAINVATKEITPLATGFEGARFTSPNDLVVDRLGNLYFSDRNGNIVYFIATDGTVRRLITTLTLPNGILLAPDEKTLYVLYNQPTLLAYPLTAPGQLGTARMIGLQGAGGGDGMAVDALGNLFVTRPSSNAVQVLNANGQSLGTIPFNEAPSNCKFGGPDLRTLYVTARTSIYTANLEVTGDRQVWPLYTVSAASYAPTALPTASIVTIFGNRLASTNETATTLPLPTVLAGTRVTLQDITQRSTPAGLFFVSPNQINLFIPSELPMLETPYRLTVTTLAGESFSEKILLTRTAPGLFAADASGVGLAAALVLRIKATGAQSYEALARFDAAQNRFIALPIDLGEATDQVYLLLYGTGFLDRSEPRSATCAIGGVNTVVAYAGPQGDFAGLNQINVLLPRALAGRGEVVVTLTIDGLAANPVKVNIK